MRSTVFPTTPGEVAVLTATEFAFDLEWNKTPSLEEVCQRFANDANRALVWFIRYRALKTWLARDGMSEWLNAGGRTPSQISEVAARLELNDCWEFDPHAFCQAVDDVAGQRPRREPRRRASVDGNR